MSKRYLRIQLFVLVDFRKRRFNQNKFIYLTLNNRLNLDLINDLTEKQLHHETLKKHRLKSFMTELPHEIPGVTID